MGISKVQRVSNRAGNINGSVLIVEYHRFSKQEARWDRSFGAFEKDLKRLYEMGFRPVSLSSYIRNEMPLAPGASPVIFTFDDSTPSQFRILPDGKLDPSCALGIWQRFSQKYPDFPVLATFYILPPVPWGQKTQLPAKIEMLKKWGCEIGSHTVSHRNLASMSDAAVKKELAGAMDFIGSLGDGADSISLPFGISPKNAQLLKAFSLQGREYSLKAAVLVGAGPAPSPNSATRNLFRLPRIQAIEGDYGLSSWLNKIESGQVYPYVQP